MRQPVRGAGIFIGNLVDADDIRADLGRDRALLLGRGRDRDPGLRESGRLGTGHAVSASGEGRHDFVAEQLQRTFLLGLAETHAGVIDKLVDTERLVTFQLFDHGFG